VKNTADNMRRMKQMQHEEQNSKLNKFFNTLSSQSNIAVENQQLHMGGDTLSSSKKTFSLHPAPIHYRSTLSYFDREGTRALTTSNRKIQLHPLRMTTRQASEQKYTKIEYNDDAIFQRKKKGGAYQEEELQSETGENGPLEENAYDQTG